MKARRPKSSPAKQKSVTLKAAARELDYRPNFAARSLRVKRAYTIGVIAEEIGDAYGSMVISGIEQFLRQNNYFFLTAIHRHDRELLQTYSQLLQSRGVEGLITVDTPIAEPLLLPTVAVAGHQNLDGVTNIVLDHKRAARLALSHLRELGHEDIAFLRGQTFSSDSAVRWERICESAQELGLCIRPELVVEMDIDDPTSVVSYPFVKRLLAGAGRSRHSSPTMIFPRLERSARSGNRASAFPKIFPSWDSMTFRRPPSRLLPSRPYGSPCRRWARSLPARSLTESKGAKNILARSPLSRCWWFENQPAMPREVQTDV